MGQDPECIFKGSARFIDCVYLSHGMLRDLREEEGVQYQMMDSNIVFFSH
jgi:hypothetical protein